MTRTHQAMDLDVALGCPACLDNGVSIEWQIKEGNISTGLIRTRRDAKMVDWDRKSSRTLFLKALIKSCTLPP
jgi:hypothetical protein